MKAFTVHDILGKPVTSASPNEQRIAVSFEGEDLTYDDLHTRSLALAAGLAAQGLRHGDRVAVVMHNRLEWVELFFAVAAAGAVIVPVNYLLTAPEISFILADCGASWVVSDDSHSAVVAGILRSSPSVRQICVGSGTENGIAYHSLFGDPGHASAAVSADDLFLLQYTSGTTGHPKGAQHTHSTVLWNTYHQIVDFDVRSDDVFYVVPGLCWAAGFHDLALATLWRGGQVVIGRSTGFEAAAFLLTVEERRVTKVLLVPTVLNRVLSCPELATRDLSSLRIVLSGGEPVPPAALKAMSERVPACNVMQVYGMSEFPTLMLLLQAPDAEQRQGSTGKACSAAVVQIVDAHGHEVLAGEIGELLCRSPATMTGYYGHDNASNDTLAGGWLHTGDLARRDDDGYIYMVGRSKDMIITGGLNVYPAEIERALADHPQVLEVAVVGEPDEKWGEVGVAIVVTNEPPELTGEQLGAYLRDQLASFKIPRRFHITSEPLPRTTSGKVRKNLLRGSNQRNRA
jgi:fatty-acyl-CoA synthase